MCGQDNPSPSKMVQGATRLDTPCPEPGRPKLEPQLCRYQLQNSEHAIPLLRTRFPQVQNGGKHVTESGSKDLVKRRWQGPDALPVWVHCSSLRGGCTLILTEPPGLGDHRRGVVMGRTTERTQPPGAWVSRGGKNGTKQSGGQWGSGCGDRLREKEAAPQGRPIQTSLTAPRRSRATSFRDFLPTGASARNQQQTHASLYCLLVGAAQCLGAAGLKEMFLFV